MEIIFQDAKDKYVGKIIAYGKLSDSKLYTDNEFTEQVTEEVVREAFRKGLLLVRVGNEFFEPVKAAQNKVTIIDVVSGAVTAKEFTAKAAE